VGDDLDLAVVEVGDGDCVAEVARQAVDLDAGLQEGGEGGRVEDLVVGGLLGVDDELWWRCQCSSDRRGWIAVVVAGCLAYLLGDLLRLLALGAAGSLLYHVFSAYCSMPADISVAADSKACSTYSCLNHFDGGLCCW